MQEWVFCARAREFFRSVRESAGALVFLETEERDKLRFIGDVTETAQSGIKVSVKPFQRLAPIQRAERWSPLASGEIPYR